MSDWKNLSVIADAVPVPLIGVDPHGTIRLANPNGAELLRYDTTNLIDHPLDVLFVDPAHAHDFSAVLFNGVLGARRFVSRRGDGSSLRIEATPSSVAGLHGLSSGWILMLRDCEPDLKAQETLSKDIENVAHDIRNPLASLKGFAGLLEREFGERLDSIGQGYLENLHSNIDRVHEQLDRLIELGRIPERELERSHLLANTVFSELEAELESILIQRGITLHLPDDPQTVFANRTRFHQVVLNLIVNSIQHMGGVARPEIVVDLKPADGGQLLVVADNGTGLSEAQHLRIFDLFRSSSFADSTHSEGLGLSIVKRIMDAHGGWIEVTSAPGQHPRFEAFFPGFPS